APVRRPAPLRDPKITREERRPAFRPWEPDHFHKLDSKWFVGAPPCGCPPFVDPSAGGHMGPPLRERVVKMRGVLSKAEPSAKSPAEIDAIRRGVWPYAPTGNPSVPILPNR